MTTPKVHVHDDPAVAWQVVSAFERHLGESLRGTEPRSHAGKRYFSYAPLDIQAFCAFLEQARKLADAPYERMPRFLDVGCGVGTKLVLARRFGFDAYGIEACAGYAEAAKKVAEYCGEPDAAEKVFHVDAFDMTCYDRYDVVYFSRLINDNARQAQLEQHIYKRLRPGALVIPVFTVPKKPWTEYIELVGDGIWRKK